MHTPGSDLPWCCPSFRQARLDFGNLGFIAGTILFLRQWATNMAGLTSSFTSQQIVMLDDTPPVHAAVHFCTPGGRTAADGSYNQQSEELLMLCWPSPGFVDKESGVWKLEWQVSRWTGLVWDIATDTQQISHEETTQLLAVCPMSHAEPWPAIQHESPTVNLPPRHHFLPRPLVYVPL